MAINTIAEQRAYKIFIDAGMTPYGACGLIGNLEAESDGFYTNRLEYLCIKRLKEAGKIYTDDSYTIAIDSGKISCEEFLHPLPGKQYGYGLAQWTTPSRKAGLYNLAHKKGVSIADENMQLEYLLTELKEKYPSVLKVLKTAKTIREASDVVLVKFESPANTGDSVKKTRALRGQNFYDKFVKKSGVKVANVNDVIKLGKKYATEKYREIGGTSNNNIFSKWVNNAGLMGCQNQPWCATFQFALDLKIFGKQKALELWHMTDRYVGYNVFATMDKFPKDKRVSKPVLGALIIYDYSHMGRVVNIYKDGSFDSLEGNTTLSGNSRDGGYVAIKRRTSTANIKCFCVIDYNSTDKTTNILTGGSYMFTCRNLVKCNTGKDVKLLQRLLIGHGYDVGKSGADGSFGNDTEAAVIKFQKANNIKVSYPGTVGTKTWKALIGL